MQKVCTCLSENERTETSIRSAFEQVRSRDKGKFTLAYPLIVMHALGLLQGTKQCAAPNLHTYNIFICLFFFKRAAKKERENDKKAVFAVLIHMYSN